MRLIVPRHAVEKFIEHIYDEPTDYIPKSLEKRVREEIMEAAQSPEIVYQGEPDMPPIHIRDRIAVVVDETKGGDGNALVSTVYPRGTFIENNGHRRQQEAGAA